MALILSLSLLLISLHLTSSTMNVLMIVADDLRPEIQAIVKEDNNRFKMYNNIFTPKMDALAAKSTMFLDAHVQVPVCGPSRSSFLTSQRPDTSHIYKNDKAGDYVAKTLPQYFKEAGYSTVSAGKIFHRDNAIPDDWDSWETIYFPSAGGLNPDNNSTVFLTTAFTDITNLPDTKIADKIIARLTKLERQGKSFFIGAGFLKPHLPFTCPEKFWNQYSVDDINIADDPFPPIDYPDASWTRSNEFRGYSDISGSGFDPAFNGQNTQLLNEDLAKQSKLGYYCAVTHVDEEIGRVLTALEDLGLAGNTVVALMGDHGWQLGEHGQWGKYTSASQSTRAPLMFHVPGVTTTQRVITQTVEFLDVMPTLIEAAGLPVLPDCDGTNGNTGVACTEGQSLYSLLTDDTGGSTSGVAYSQVLYSSGQYAPSMAYGVISQTYQYVRHVATGAAPDYIPDWNTVYGEQLYDLTVDPTGDNNVAADATYSVDKDVMYALLLVNFP